MERTETTGTERVKKRRSVALNNNEQKALASLLDATNNGQSIVGFETSHVMLLSAVAKRLGNEICCAKLRSMNWTEQCSHRAAVRRAGFAFCGIHDPGPSLDASQVAALAMPTDAPISGSSPWRGTIHD